MNPSRLLHFSSILQYIYRREEEEEEACREGYTTLNERNHVPTPF